MEYSLKQYVFVIRELTAREIKRKYSRSVLGILWSVLQPLLFMVVMSFVFSGYSPSNSNFPVYYLTGYIFFQLFQTATTTSMTAFEDNQRLFQKSKLPREVFVLSRDYTALVNLGFSLIALVAVLVIFRVKPNLMMVLLFVDMLCEMLFTIGVSFILATVFVFYKDIKFLWNNFITLLVHIVAIFVPIERYPDYLKRITEINPLYFYPNIARRCVLEGTYNIAELQRMVIWAVLMFLTGLIFFKINENKIVKKL